MNLSGYLSCKGVRTVIYLVWVKTSPAKANATLRALRNLEPEPYQGIHLYYTMNVFGEWDCGILFDTKNHEQAIKFVDDIISPISGVTETHLMPTSPIKEYITWK